MGIEYGDGEFISTQALSDVLHGIEFGCIGRQFQERDVIRHLQVF